MIGCLNPGMIKKGVKIGHHVLSYRYHPLSMWKILQVLVGFLRHSWSVGALTFAPILHITRSLDIRKEGCQTEHQTP